ncbi:MAG: hypothetical protein KDD42_07895, partial [Bdellovibrionales bacterium]|nr:hypothetical protein [Bdellovibrionales bacterium]
RKSVLATGETVGYEFKNKALAYCAIHPGGKSPRIQLANTILTHLGRALFEYVATKKILQNKINGGLPAVRIVHSELEMSVDYERLAQQLEALKFDTPLPVRFDRGNYIPEKETAIRQRILRSAFFGVLGTICTESGVPKAESIAKKFL